MNAQKQRTKIAEVFGWRKSPVSNVWCSPDNWLMAKGGAYEVWWGIDQLPDYLNDLSAMHEAEKILRNNQFHFVDYLRELWKVINPEVEYTGNLGYLGFDFIRASAAQRAEAFLRTLNLWEESP